MTVRGVEKRGERGDLVFPEVAYSIENPFIAAMDAANNGYCASRIGDREWQMEIWGSDMLSDMDDTMTYLEYEGYISQYAIENGLLTFSAADMLLDQLEFL